MATLLWTDAARVHLDHEHRIRKGADWLSQANGASPGADRCFQVQPVGLPSPLRSLLDTVAAELVAVELQLAQLYDDLFVETCPACDSD
jgi:hypothetical protein